MVQTVMSASSSQPLDDVLHRAVVIGELPPSATQPGTPTAERTTSNRDCDASLHISHLHRAKQRREDELSSDMQRAAPCLKVEIGGDAQSTEGTEGLSHAHSEKEENYYRDTNVNPLSNTLTHSHLPVRDRELHVAYRASAHPPSSALLLCTVADGGGRSVATRC